MFEQRSMYDKSILLSPEGRLYQVEYAREAVKRGKSVVAILSKEGIFLGVETYENPLIIEHEKIFYLGENIYSVSCGLSPDARYLADKCREFIQEEKLKFGRVLSIDNVARHLANICHSVTLASGYRPFAVKTMIFGYDTKYKIFTVDPAGILQQVYACYIGRHLSEAEKILKEEYKKDIKEKEAINLIKRIFEKINIKKYKIYKYSYSEYLLREVK